MVIIHMSIDKNENVYLITSITKLKQN